MSKTFLTGKMPRATGKGTAPQDFIVGGHAPDYSPFFYFPWNPSLAQLLDRKWFYFNLREQGYDANEFTVTNVGSGTIAFTTDKKLLFTNGVSDNDLLQLQHLYTFTPAANRFAAMFVRVQVSEATQLDFYGGWSSTDTSIVAGEPADHALFKKDDGDTILNGRTNDAGGTGSETANLLTNFAAATDYDLGVVLQCTSGSVGTVSFMYKLATATDWTQVVKTTDFPDAAVRPTLLVQNGDANSRTMTLSEFAFTGYEA